MNSTATIAVLNGKLKTTKRI